MAFVKKTWTDRNVELPNGRIITHIATGETERVLVGYDEGDVYDEGDRINADNFNNLENRIKEGFDTIPAGTDVSVTGTLIAGQTTITLANEAIDSNSTFDFYTSVFGVNPTAVSVSGGSITLTFDSQASDIGVKVVVK